MVVLTDEAGRRTDYSPGVAPLADGRLRELYDRHGRTLFKYLMRVTCGDAQLSEELVNDTMFRAWRSMPAALSEDGAMPLPWLYTVARRVAIDVARKRNARPVEISHPDIGAIHGRVDDPIERMINANSVRKALNRLDHRHREVLFEVFICGRQPAEVAQVLNIPVGTVKSRLHYALRDLRGLLQEPRAA